MANSRLCSIPDCDKPSHSRGWCHMHYQRWRRYGDLGPGCASKASKGDLPRFYEEVVLAYEGDECLIWPYSKSSTGYGQMQADGRIRQVHWLVCKEVNGPPPTPKHQAAHSCGNGHEACVTKRHLSWKTRSENEADKLVHGTSNRGERHGMAKLAEETVREIRSLEGIMMQRQIAVQFGISPGTVGDIHRRKSWAWLE